MNEQKGQRHQRRQLIGIVMSNKMSKTLVVEVEKLARHPTYEKVMRKLKQYKVHSEESKAKVGDRVRIMETRPLSKDKRWRLVEVLKK